MNSSHGTVRLPQSAGELGRAGAVVTVAAVGSNLLAYLVPLLGARALGADDFGGIATVMALLAIAAVPGTGLQLAIAVAVAKHGAVHRRGRLTALVTACGVVPLLLITPLLAQALRLPWQVVVLTAGMTGCVIAGNAALGLLQGQMRFSRLAAGMVALALARCGGIIIGLLAGLELTGLLLLGFAGALVSVGAIYFLTPASMPATAQAPGMSRAVWAAGSATLALFVLSYADLLAARNLLPAAESADYAVLNVLTKAAIWAPQMIGIVALPYFAREVKRSRLFAALAVSAMGVVIVLTMWMFGPLVVRFAGGPAYGHLAGHAAAFAALGAVYALVFMLTNAQVAAGAKAPALPLWTAAAIFVIAAYFVVEPTVTSIVTSALVAAAVSATALVALMWSTMRATQASESA